MELNVNVRTVSDLLSVNKKYVVPRFQRGYSWGQDELSAFWMDITHAIRKDEGTLSPSEHFLGAIVVIGEDKSSLLQIVDGQQRLTTITILLRELVAALEPIAPDIAKALYANNIEGKDDDGKQYFKLANETPKPFFQKSIQFLDRSPGKPSTDEERALWEASQYFGGNLATERLVEVFGEKPTPVISDIEWRKTILLAIRDQVLRHLKLVFLSVANEDDAYTIFETLNARGLSLSVVDLVKNEIFKNLKGEHPDDDAKTEWKKLQTTLASRERDVKIETFFRHFWLSNYSFVREGRIFVEFKSLQRQRVITVETFFARLIESGDQYLQIANPQMSDWPRLEEREVFRALEAINLFGVTQVRSLLLALLELYRWGKLKLPSLKKYIQVLENFHFAYTAVCSSRPSGLDGMYSKAARRARSESDPRVALDELTTNLKTKRPSFAKFDDSFGKIVVTKSETKNKKLVQYILRRHERELQGTGELELDAVSIEHIADQSTQLGSVGMLGNLLPLDLKLNNEMTTSGFVAKVQTYKRSGLKTVADFCKAYGHAGQWGDQEIRDRTANLAKFSYEKVWRID